MSSKTHALWLHDLRAPLARAITYSKLLEEASSIEAPELLCALQKSLEDLDQLLCAQEAVEPCPKQNI